jgi:hypothetical protein
MSLASTESYAQNYSVFNASWADYPRVGYLRAGPLEPAREFPPVGGGPRQISRQGRRVEALGINDQDPESF